MSHELEITKDGKVLFAYTGQDPWHGLGTKLHGRPTPKRIMQAAGLNNWDVQVEPFYKPANGVEQINDDLLGLITPAFGSMIASEVSGYLQRKMDGRVLDERVTMDWKPVQNEEAFDFFNEWIEAGDMTMETAGSLFDGQIVFALAKCGDDFEITPGDVVKPYMLFTNNFRYGYSTDIRMVNERVVCKNTHAVAFSETAKNRFSMSHVRKFDKERAKEGLGFTKNAFEAYRDTMRKLTAVQYTDEQLKEFAKKIFPVTGKNVKKVEFSRNAEDFLTIVDKQPGADFAPKSVFNLYNGVTFMASHMLGRTDEGRLAEAWYGKTQVKSNKALELCLEMVA